MRSLSSISFSSAKARKISFTLRLIRVILVLSDVFDELLRDRRAAVLVAAEQPALDRADRAPPVYAVVLVEALVLDGDDGVLEIVRNFVAVDPFAVFACP